MMIFTSILLTIQLFSTNDSLIKSNIQDLNTVPDFMCFVRENLFTEQEKVRAITLFICDKLEYDDNTLLVHKKNNDPHLIIKNKKAICSEYSIVFKSLCDSLGIKSEIILGITDKHYAHYLKTSKIGFLHNWNVVYIQGKKYLIDPTWCDEQNDSIDEQWYLTDPKVFIKTHYPCGNAILMLDYYMFERFKSLYSCTYLEVVNKCQDFASECENNYKWQLLDNPITYKQFINVK